MRSITLICAGLLASAALAQPALSQPALAAPEAARTAAVSEDARLTAFLDHAFAAELKLQPQLATRLGLDIGADRWDDTSDAGRRKLIALRRKSVKAMRRQFDRERLSPNGRTNYDIWEGELARMELRDKFQRYQPPFYSTLYSASTQLPDFLINTHEVNDAADVRAYIARLRGMPAKLDLALKQTKASHAQGIKVPRFQVDRLIAGSKSLTAGAPFGGEIDAPLMADARAKIGKLSASGKLTAEQADAMVNQASAAVLALRPAYARIIAWAESVQSGAPGGRVGAVSLPGGDAWYAAALKLNTTLDLTPAEVHATGLAEVKRIEDEQDALARKAGLADRLAFYADRAKRFPPVPYTDALREDYLRRSNEAVERNSRLLGSQFNQLPVYKMEVIREPSFSEVPGGAAHAAAPSPDGVRPGRVYLHLLGETLDPAKTIDLMCHEAVPGHVMQGDIAVRQTGVPKFRTIGGGYVAYGEGWALYAELLCKEMGAFPDIASDFMRLDAELFRAARLVTDTGIHALGWTEDEAMQYMVSKGRLREQQARAEVRRYITLPGQATGYKIGMIEIMRLRRKAEAELGAKFDIKTFNDLVVGGGGMPLPVLQRRVDDWIAAQR